MADASWKEGNVQVAAHVIANLYNKRVETANSPIMNHYAGSFHTRVSILSRRLMPPHVICVGGACRFNG